MNKAIETITSDIFSPGLPIQPKSPSQDSCIDFSKISFYENEDIVPDFYANLETLALEVDRLQMTQEDHRSHEFRKMQGNLDESNSIVLEFNEQELENAIRDLTRASRYEESTTCVVEAGGIHVKIILSKPKTRVYEKKNLIQSGMQERERVLTQLDSNTLIQNFTSDLEQFMSKSYADSLEFSNEIISVKHLQGISQSEFTRIHQQKIEHQRLVSKLEWQCAEIAMIKEQYQMKINKIQEFERQILEKRNEIRNEDFKMQTQRLIVSKDQEIIQQQKKVIEKIIEDNRKKFEIVKNTLAEVKKHANFIIKPLSVPKVTLEKKKSEEAIVLKPRRNEPKYQLDFEIQLVQQEIKSLEQSLCEGSQNSESIQTKLDRLKTKESNLKSNRVINASLERSNSVSSKISYFERERTFSSIISSQSKPSLDSKVLLNSNKININTSIKKPPVQSPAKIPENSNKSSSEMQNYLKLRENRLVEKEEELTKRENMLMKNWGKVPDGMGILTMVQNEQRNLKILRSDLEKRQRNLEQDVLAYARRCSEMKAKERDVLNTIESFDAFIYQKKQVENRLQFLLSMFEDISNSSMHGINIH